MSYYTCNLTCVLGDLLPHLRETLSGLDNKMVSMWVLHYFKKETPRFYICDYLRGVISKTEARSL